MNIFFYCIRDFIQNVLSTTRKVITNTAFCIITYIDRIDANKTIVFRNLIILDHANGASRRQCRQRLSVTFQTATNATVNLNI